MLCCTRVQAEALHAVVNVVLLSWRISDAKCQTLQPWTSSAMVAEFWWQAKLLAPVQSFQLHDLRPATFVAFMASMSPTRCHSISV